MSAVPSIDSFLTLGADVPQDTFRTWGRSVENNLHLALAYANLAVNGFHQVSQENVDAAVGNGGYPSDQWLFNLTHSATATAKRVATPFASRLDIPRGVEIEVTTGAAAAAGNFLTLTQRIEGERLRGRLNWGTANAKNLRVGAVLRSNVSGRGYLSVTNSAQNRAYLRPFDLVANTDTWIDLTIPGDTSGTWLETTGIGLRVQWCFSSGSTFHGAANAWNASNVFAASDVTNFAATTGNKIWVGPVVILPGSELPTFSEVMACQRHLDDETRNCQRYFRLSASGGGAIVAANACDVLIVIEPPMRAPPATSLRIGTSVIVAFGVAQYTATAITDFSVNAAYWYGRLTSSGMTTGAAGVLPAAISFNARI